MKVALCALFFFLIVGPTLAEPDFRAHLRSYSYQLNAQEPFQQPFVALFEKGDKKLFYLAAHHQNREEQPTFRLIREVLESEALDCVILEGFSRDKGVSPESMASWAAKAKVDGVYRGGEVAYAIQLATEKRIPFVGGEPSDREIADQLLEQGYKANDLLGMYFTRQVPQYRRADALGDLKETFNKFIKHERKSLGLTDSPPFPYSKYLAWYEAKNGEPFSSDLDNEVTAPIADGKYFTQRLSAKIGAMRDLFILRVVEQALSKHDRVLIIYGAGHLVTQRRAIEHWLGPPVRQSPTW